MMASEQAEAAVDAPTASSGNYHLHVFPFSLYSIMARLTLAFGQDDTSPTTSSLSVRLKLVNLHREDHISEAYLTEVNPKGQVCTATSACPSSLTTYTLTRRIGPSSHGWYSNIPSHRQLRHILLLLSTIPMSTTREAIRPHKAAPKTATSNTGSLPLCSQRGQGRRCALSNSRCSPGRHRN